MGFIVLHNYKIVYTTDMILDKEYYEDYWSDWSRHKEDPDEALRMLTCIPNVKVLIDQQHEINGISIWGSPWGS